MESDPETLQATAQAIGIISIIPIILYALWADAIENEIRDFPENYKPSDLENESSKLKIGSLIILVFQLSLYLESPLLRQAYPIASHITLLSVLCLQLFVQYQTQRTLFPKLQENESLFLIFLKLIRSWVIGIIICSIFLTLFLQMGYFLAHQLQVKTQIGSLILVASSTLALVLGILVNYALAPFHILKTLPHESLHSHPFQKQVTDLFQKYSLPTPKVWQINLEKLRLIDLSLLGFSRGRSLFQYSLFVSRPALQELTDAELNALLSIELSHILLNHPQRKLLSSCILLCGSALLSILTGITLLYVFHRADLADEFGIGVGLFSFLTSFRWMSAQTKYFEIEADLYSIQKLNSDWTQWSSALRKLDILMIKNHPQFETLSLPPGKGLPETEQRIQVILSCLNQIEPIRKEPPPLSKAS